MRVFAGRLVSPLIVLAGLCLPPPSDAQDRTFSFTDVDLKLLEEADLLDARLEKQGLVYSDAGVTEYLTTVGMAVMPDRPAPERVTWRFRVLRDSVPNAFALPNGSIYVDSGLLALLENEDQLASVLAHEATHVLARHSYLSYRSYRKKATASTIIGTMANGSNSAAGVVASVIAGVTQVMLVNTTYGYSRELEAEADQEGLTRLAAGGFDVTQMAAAFRVLQATCDLELESEPTFYNDHPKLQDRIEYVTRRAAERAGGAVESAEIVERTRRFTSAVEHPARDSVQQAIDARRYRSAVASASRLVAANPESSDMRYLLAEAYRALGPRQARPSAQELDSSGRKKAQSNLVKLTAAEEERRLVTLPEGQAAWNENQRTSEQEYRKALSLDATNFKAYRGLGLLYEKTGRSQDALAAYRQYLAMALDPADRARIERRIEAIGKNPSNPE